MAQSTKLHWTTPALRQFETPEEVWAFYGNLTRAERERLAEMLVEMRSSQVTGLKRASRA